MTKEKFKNTLYSLTLTGCIILFLLTISIDIVKMIFLDWGIALARINCPQEKPLWCKVFGITRFVYNKITYVEPEEGIVSISS